MNNALSLDLRRRIIALWQKKKLTTEELASHFDVGVATIGRLKRLYRETGSVEPRPHGGGRKRIIAEAQEPLVIALVQAHPDWTEEAYAEALLREYKIKASPVSVGRVIRRHGYSVKKRRSSPKKGTPRRSRRDDDNTQTTSATSPLRVWFSWTKPARTSR